MAETTGQLSLRDPDVRLMVRVRNEDPGAFEELVEKYQHRLVAVLHHVVGNAEEAEDLAQEAFLRIYRARKKYRARAKFSTWLFTIANNLALNALRSRQRKPVVPLDVTIPARWGRAGRTFARTTRRRNPISDFSSKNWRTLSARPSKT